MSYLNNYYFDSIDISKLPTMDDCLRVMSRFMEPSPEQKLEYIKHADFSFMQVEDENFNKTWEPTLYEKGKHHIFAHIMIKGNKLNDKIYIVDRSLDNRYIKVRNCNSKDNLYEFFTRVEASAYTQEDVNKDIEYHKRFKESQLPLIKKGTPYLKETVVIVNLRTGEESPIQVEKLHRGYIMYKKYYIPDGERKIVDIATGNTILEYDYGDRIETDKHVIFRAKYNNYNDPKQALILEKDTGKVSVIE